MAIHSWSSGTAATVPDRAEDVTRIELHNKDTETRSITKDL